MKRIARFNWARECEEAFDVFVSRSWKIVVHVTAGSPVTWYSYDDVDHQIVVDVKFIKLSLSPRSR